MVETLRNVLLATLLALAGCSAGGTPPAQPWQSTGLKDRPLAGRIWHTDERRFVRPAELARALAAADFVLLGETHDNPDHHRIQAWAVQTLFAAGTRPGLAIEMVRKDQQPALDAHRAAHPGDTDGIGTALGWEKSGWPAWRLYSPVIAPFAASDRAIVAANLPTALIRAIARHGYEALPAARRAELALERPMPAEIEQAIAREMVAAHCGQIPDARAVPFARIQIARDAVMADALREAAASTGKGVLVAGSGHVRRDRGVPLHMRRQGAGGRVLTLAPIEVAAGMADPGDYAKIYGAEVAPFDYLWFTPRQHREDPCGIS